ncbi:serine/threonine-protein kinase [Tychonema sp. LEGE 07203]|uniref:serine/threonine-protein kinase n=1 Tax=Tychonema sp. LEGE 07203 TaxID=1828671 RepID=UPI0018821605|nr:serine/threonine-protein kinase [Tychonema sp. LEGE 07203]MBE9092891.1 serine/threonine protein kinase [Tychonema sp. LEGE 07203]
MSYCINPNCQNPENLDRATVCTSCESNLLLKGRYRVFHPLGQNLGCRTFLAVDEDQPAQPRCVIQQFCGRQQSVADSGAQLNRRFRGGASILDELGKHPQIPKLLASFEVEGSEYLVQEYIPGRNLADRLSEKGVLKEIHIWYLLSELLPVLQLVHDNQLIHGDIKPSNIIHRKTSQTSLATAGKEDVRTLPCEEESGLVLVDFGGAVPANSRPLKTETVTGSAEYAAPEQIKGQAIFSSDIYSLGVTCIHLLTGMSPFDLFDIKSDSWAWRHYLKVPVSARLGRILDKMVEREVSKRYRSTEAILKDLKYGPTPIDAIASKPRWTLALWGGAAVALISVVLGSRLPSTVPSAFTSSEPVSTIPDIRFDPPPMQNFSRQESQSGPAVRTLADRENPVWAVAVTPNGRVIVSGNNDGTISLLHKRHGKVLKTIAAHLGPVWSVAVSPDGRTIASGGADGTTKLWNFYSGKLIRTLDGDKDGVFSVVFSPDGRALASVGKDKTLKLWEVEGGAELETLKRVFDEVQSVAFSPDRETLAIGSSDGKIEMWNWQTGELKETLWGHSEAVWSLAISPDGQTLASGSWDKTVKLWDISPNHQSRQPNGSLLRTLIGHSDKVKSLAFSPDGDKLASADLSGTIKLWRMSPGERWQMNPADTVGTLKGHSTWVELAFNPQDKTLISGSFDDTIKVWRLSP